MANMIPPHPPTLASVALTFTLYTMGVLSFGKHPGSAHGLFISLCSQWKAPKILLWSSLLAYNVHCTIIRSRLSQYSSTLERDIQGIHLYPPSITNWDQIHKGIIHTLIHAIRFDSQSAVFYILSLQIFLLRFILHSLWFSGYIATTHNLIPIDGYPSYRYLTWDIWRSRPSLGRPLDWRLLGPASKQAPWERARPRWPCQTPACLQAIQFFRGTVPFQVCSATL